MFGMYTYGLASLTPCGFLSAFFRNFLATFFTQIEMATRADLKWGMFGSILNSTLTKKGKELLEKLFRNLFQNISFSLEHQL